MGAERRAEEWRLSTGALRALGWTAVPVVGGAGVIAGVPGLAGAVAGLALVTVLFAGAAALLALVVDRSPTTALTVLVLGLGVRLLAYVAVLTALDAQGWVHRPSLAAATGLGVAITLAHELRLLARMPRLFWIDADTDRPRAVSNATRSQLL